MVKHRIWRRNKSGESIEVNFTHLIWGSGNHTITLRNSRQVQTVCKRQKMFQDEEYVSSNVSRIYSSHQKLGGKHIIHVAVQCNNFRNFNQSQPINHVCLFFKIGPNKCIDLTREKKFGLFFTPLFACLQQICKANWQVRVLRGTFPNNGKTTGTSISHFYFTLAPANYCASFLQMFYRWLAQY